MKTLIKTIFICIFTLSTKTAALSQSKFPGGQPGYETPNPSSFIDVPTPQAASLGKYGDVPVSYFTGNPNISIPLYSLTVRNVTMPITLDYDASGVMPNSLPSIAGQNWTLNIGGVITRTVKGRYDEWVYPKQTGLSNTKNYFQCHDMLKSLIDKPDNYKSLKNEIMYNNYDFAPDEYSFSFMGKSGKFFMDENGNWRVMSEDNLEVLFDPNDKSNFTSPFIKTYPYLQAIDRNQPKTIYGFTIRDTGGNRYVFGYNQNAIEYTTNLWHMSVNEDNESWHAMSWFLTKVYDKYGNELFSLDYKRGTYIIQVFNSFYSYYVNEKVFGLLGTSCSYTTDNGAFPYTLTINSPVYLKNVHASNGLHVDISSETAGDELATEKLYASLYTNNNGVYGLYDKMVAMVDRMTGAYKMGAFSYLQPETDSLKKFRYNPKNDNACDLLSHSRIRTVDYIAIQPDGKTRRNGTDCIGFKFYQSCVNRRLRLDSVMVKNNSVHYGSSKEEDSNGVYRFKYNRFDELPGDYLTTMVDHWGYYNGREYAKNGRPFENIYSLRQPDSTYAKIGILYQIHYPTGGVCNFEYEPNTYTQKLSYDRQSMIRENGICGGLRIKSIKLYDTKDCNNLLEERDFTYNIPNTETSSGELFATPIYKWDNWKLKCELKNATYHISTTQTSSVVPLANGFSKSIGYSYVTETVRDNKDTNKFVKKKIYRYRNLSDPDTKDKRFTLTFGYADMITPFEEFSDMGFSRGILMSEMTYDGDNCKRESVSYKYRNDKYLDNNKVLTSNFLYECYGNSAQYAHYTGGVYCLYYPKYDIMECNDSIWDNDRNGIYVKKYSFNRYDKEYMSTFPYCHNIKLRLTESETISNGNNAEKKIYSYGDFNANNGNFYYLYKKMFCIVPSAVEHQRNGTSLFSTQTTYMNQNINNSAYLVPYMLLRKNGYAQTDTLVTYFSYSKTGMPLCCKELGKAKMYMKWALHDNYLMMIGNDVISTDFTDENVYDSEKCLSKIRSIIAGNPGIYTGYTYNPLYGPKAIVSPNNYATIYSYDDFGRLKSVVDPSNRLKESYKYNLRK